MRIPSNYRKLKLLATTSLLAGAVAAMPVSLDIQFDQPLVQSAQADSCCFAPGTKILMADGSERRIETIRTGDLVMGRGGKCNRVVAVEQPLLGQRKLYGFNGGQAFVTAEHPFWTMSGWRALDPQATSAENPDLTVNPLSRGDLLARLTPAESLQLAGNTVLNLDFALEFQALLSIEAVEGNPETPLYNLLLDGDHSYVANGYLVHNKGGGDGGGGDGGGSGSGGDRDGGDRDGGDRDGGDRDGGDSDNSGPGSENSGRSGDRDDNDHDDNDHDDNDHDDNDRDDDGHDDDGHDDDGHDDDGYDDDGHDDDGHDDDGHDDDDGQDNSPDDDGTPDQGSGDVGAGGAAGGQNNSPDDDGTPDQGSGDAGAGGAAGGQDNSPDDDGTPDQGSGDVNTNG